MNVVYATQTGQVALPEGGMQYVQKGEHWAADDPIVLRAPGMFSPDPRYGMRFTVQPDGFDDPPVEQATAAPGERRSAVRRG